MEHKVSIIITIYNCETYIKDCVRSLFEQTLDTLEYIFINDATKDNSIVLLNDIINVRGKGKFIFEEIVGETRSDRIRLKLKKYM